MSGKVPTCLLLSVIFCAVFNGVGLLLVVIDLYQLLPIISKMWFYIFEFGLLMVVLMSIAELVNIVGD